MAFFGRTLTLDADAYWTNVWDYQANTLQTGSNGAILSLITNVGSVVSRGVEGDANWRPFGGLVFNGSVGYNDAYYQSFPNAPAIQGAVGATQNLSGRPVVQAPHWTANLEATYTHPINQTIDGYKNGEVAYHSGYYGYIDDSSYSRLPGYVIGNLRVGASFSGGRYDLSLWVHNIGDARYFNAVTPAITGSGGYFASVAEPRMFGATLKAAF